MKTICFDLEGPLSPQDNAFEVSADINDGKELFSKISRYDDYLAQQDRKNHEPGDTLALIAPFLVNEDISKKEIKKVSKKAKIVKGANELINNLKKDDWDVYIISTSYKYHAHTIAKELNVDNKNVYSTNLDLTELRSDLTNQLSNQIKTAKSDIIEMEYSNELIRYLDDFFFNKLPKTSWGNPLEKIEVRGGKRKIEAIKEVVNKKDIKLSEIVAVGDSITDFKMLKEIRESNGKSIVFNGNKYAVPYAEFGAASHDIRVIEALIKEKEPKKLAKKWEQNQKEINKNIEKIPQDFKKYGINKLFKNNDMKNPVLNYLLNKTEKQQEKIIEQHKYFRENVRGEAAQLG